MKISWIAISVAAGFLAGIIFYLFTEDILFSTIVAIIVLVIVQIYNPIRRYMRAFWTVLSMIVLLNKWVFKISGSYEEHKYQIGSVEVESVITVFLIILSIVLLVLDYLERNGHLFKHKENQETIHEIKSRKVKELLKDGSLLLALNELKSIAAQNNQDDLREEIINARANISQLKNHMDQTFYEQVLQKITKQLIDSSYKNDEFFYINRFKNLYHEINIINNETEKHF